MKENKTEESLEELFSLLTRSDTWDVYKKMDFGLQYCFLFQICATYWLERWFSVSWLGCSQLMGERICPVDF